MACGIRVQSRWSRTQRPLDLFRTPRLIVKREAQAFRSEVNGSLPPSEVAGTGAMSAALNHLKTESRAPETTLKPHASMPSLLHAHTSLM
jgi:hypothetical protein